MTYVSPLLNILSKNVRNECKSMTRDFCEIEKLQSSVRDFGPFINGSISNIEKKIILILQKIKPELQITKKFKDDLKDCWIVDFIDNRLNFSRANENFYINISLKEENEIKASFFFNPVRDESFFFQKGLGSFKNDERIRVSCKKKISNSVISIFKKIEESDDLEGIIFAKNILSKEKVSQRESGSIFSDLCSMASGKLDCCLFANPCKKIISICNLITRESGGMVINLVFKDSKIYLAGNKYIEKLVKEMLENNN